MSAVIAIFLTAATCIVFGFIYPYGSIERLVFCVSAVVMGCIAMACYAVISEIRKQK